MKKRYLPLLVVLLFVLLPLQGAAAPTPVKITYPNFTLASPFSSRIFSDKFTLVGATKGVCDLTLTYDVDLSRVVSPSPSNIAIAQIGLADDRGDLIVDMASFSPFPAKRDPSLQNLNDKHNLQSLPVNAIDERAYNAPGADTITGRIGSTNNYGIWYDRDGVSDEQAVQLPIIGTYNTGGKYSVKIVFHAVNNGKAWGTAFASVNALGATTVQGQGFFTSGPTDVVPPFAGRGFTGRTGIVPEVRIGAVLRAFSAANGTVDIRNMTVTGCKP